MEKGYYYNTKNLGKNIGEFEKGEFVKGQTIEGVSDAELKKMNDFFKKHKILYVSLETEIDLKNLGFAILFPFFGLLFIH